MSEQALPRQLEQERPDSRARLWLLSGFCLALLILLGISVEAYRQSQRAEAARSEVTRTLLVLKQALELENAATLMESRHRAYLVQGDPEFLRRREGSYDQALAMTKQLAQLVADNPAQVARAAEVRTHLQERHAIMQRLTELAGVQGMAAARAGFRPYGPASTDPIRGSLGEFRATEEQLLARRSRLADSDADRLDLMLVYGTGTGLLIIIAAVVALLRQLLRRERMADQLARANAEALHALELVDATHDGVLIYDAGTLRISYVNRGALEQVGYRRDELLGMSVLGIKRGFDEAAFRQLLAPLLAGEVDALAFETTHHRKDGSEIPVEISVRYTMLVDGAPSLVTVARDISVRKRGEQRLLDLNRDLTERQVALEAANRELDAFSYSVSHDLRAPLRHIDGYARMLVEDIDATLAPEPRRYLQAIIDSARRMGLLIDDLLNLARLGRKPLVRQQVDMQRLVENAVSEVVASNHTGNGVPPAEVFVATLPLAVGDSALLKQVWVNLISNAFKYSAPRGTEARIVVSGERSGELIRYCVNDNGVGFDMRYADKLFGVFQRLHPQDQFEGTGVGLAIVQRVVTRHGGRVTATGELDRGATFCFELPLIEAVA